jgi:hypothetical protein
MVVAFTDCTGGNFALVMVACIQSTSEQRCCMWLQVSDGSVTTCSEKSADIRYLISIVLFARLTLFLTHSLTRLLTCLLTHSQHSPQLDMANKKSKFSAPSRKVREHRYENAHLLKSSFE